MRVRVRPILSLVLAAGAVVAAAPPQQTALPGRETSAESVASYGLSQNMPVDPEVTVGTLPNGLHYYIRGNVKPPKRAELRLVVKAGSVLEDDDQRGLAHFVEHMEFEGTQHFPRQSIMDFLGSLGLSLGADANAATSYDETQYTLRVPTDVPGALDRALLVMEDWAHAATFDQAGIDRERGIVLSEWRMNLGAGERTADRVRRAQLEGSRYVDRSPIGTPEGIQSARRDQLLRFYHDWYRPDLMAVIAVGDFDRAPVEALIKQHFSSLPSPSPERQRTQFDVPERPGTRYTILTDKETTATAVEMSDLRPARNQASVGGYRDLMLDQLFASMLGARLDELAQGASAPFIRAAAQRALFPSPRTKDEAALEALVANDGVTRGLDALVTELQRVQRFGFTTSELNREKQAMMLSYAQVVTESPDRESASRADEYTRNFLEGEALPTIWQELAFHRRFLPGITLEEMNKLALDWFPPNNRLVVVSAPEGTGVVLPTEEQLAAAVNAASSKALTAYAESDESGQLMETKPAPGKIVKTTPRPSGITEWTLSNGATVVLKPTTLKEDEIVLRAFAPGGTSVATDADFVPARVADMVITAGGVGRFNATQLDHLLRSKFAGANPYVDEYDEGITGRATPQDLETLFQLVYLRFTQPRADPNAFAAAISQAKALVANQMASPEFVFNRTVDSLLDGNNPRRQPDTLAAIEKWNLDKSLAFYKARFADASNFTFVLVGSFTPDGIKPFVEQYLASLPATHARETWRDLGITPPKGPVERTVSKGIAPKSQVAIVFSGPFEYDDLHKLALRSVAMVLQSRLLDTIRQELGGTYSITAADSTEKIPRPGYQLRIEWTCDPAQTDALVRRVFQEIEFVRGVQFQPGQVSRIHDALQHDYDMSSLDNGFVLGQIARRYENGEVANLGAISDYASRLSSLTGEAVHAAAMKYLDTGSYVKVILMPEGK
ncbi:MAG TPA: insulinase family protein [Vicinamibacterales bacterium]